MKNFNDFINEQEEQEGGYKPWKATKADVLDFWSALRDTTPIILRAVPKEHKGTRFKEDGIRITGSPQFINGILAKLKDLLAYEDKPGYRLDVEYREIIKDGESAYVFYLHAEEESSTK